MDEAWPILEPVAADMPTTRIHDDAAVLAAWSAHHDELYVFLVRQVRDDAIAEDLLQETYLRFMQQVRSGPMPDNRRAWLYRVAANLAVSRARHVRVAVHGLLQLAGRVAGAEPVGPPDRAVLERESRSELLDALSGLHPDARAALLLSAQGFSGCEIARTLGRSAMATRTLMSRARRQVRARLEREEASA